jgi:hypothetical protein
MSERAGTGQQFRSFREVRKPQGAAGIDQIKKERQVKTNFEETGRNW